MNKLHIDNIGYKNHLVFGIGWWEYPSKAAIEVAKLINYRATMVCVGDDTVLDELIILELGRHVEMEFELQKQASMGIHWNNLGQYLEGLVDGN